jgi:hypothetical protein
MSEAWRKKIFDSINIGTELDYDHANRTMHSKNSSKYMDIDSVLDYIEEMTRSLGEFALRNDKGLLAHLLHVAGDEARAQARRVGQNSKPGNAPFN